MSSPSSAAVPDDERWQLVVRIAASRQFAKSRQLKDILFYIVRRSLSASDVTIKEHEIGHEALGRGADFNPHEDNIVRVQIGQLRKRLGEYFADEGKNEALRLVVPKGSYVPHFEPVPAVTEARSAIVGEESAPAADSVPVSVSKDSRSLLSGLLIALCGLCFLAGRLMPFAGAPAKPVPRTSIDHLWRGLFGGPQSTNIVVSDACLVMLQDTLGTDIKVEEYLSPRYPAEVLSRAKSAPLRSALELIAARQYTSLADLNAASMLVQFGHRYSTTPAQIRYARHLNIREFKTGNFILLGSRRGIPWVQLFEPWLDFSMEKDDSASSYFSVTNVRAEARMPRGGRKSTAKMWWKVTRTSPSCRISRRRVTSCSFWV